MDEFAAEDLGRLEDRQLGDDLVELLLQQSRIGAQVSRRLVEIDNRQGYEDHGYLSVTSWLRDRCGVSAREATRQVFRARSLHEMAGTAAAYADGEVGVSTVDQLVSARKRHPGTFAEHEAGLVEAVKPLNPKDSYRVVEYWRQALDDYHQYHEQRYQQRRFNVSATFEGMVRGDFDLDPESGEIVLTAIRALAETTDTTDTRTPQQRRADALVDLCRDYLDHGDTPTQGGEKPHLTLLVSLETLEDRAGRPCELDETGVITAQAAHRLACDAGISRIITKGQSEPLDVGRRTRTIPPAIRRALNLRDGGCVAKGCHRPVRWCDAHHIIHWLDGGITALINLILLCRRHHRMAHEAKLKLKVPP